VRVVSRSAARPALFEEARAAVLEQYLIHRSQESIARYLARAFARYRVDIDGEAVTSFAPGRRLAFRGVLSGED